MITIVTGSVVADLHAFVNAPGTMVFEDYFANYTWHQYEECWRSVNPSATVICKTRDAVLAAPVNSQIVRVGRSVRFSTKDQLVHNEMTQETFRLLFN